MSPFRESEEVQRLRPLLGIAVRPASDRKVVASRRLSERTWNGSDRHHRTIAGLLLLRYAGLESDRR
jgi:hypothetical protein